MHEDAPLDVLPVLQNIMSDRARTNTEYRFYSQLHCATCGFAAQKLDLVCSGVQASYTHGPQRTARIVPSHLSLCLVALDEGLLDPQNRK